jgi:hypothetical protein
VRRRGDLSIDLVETLHRSWGDRITLIGAGGIHAPSDMLRLLQAGAALVQIESGLVYAGPGLPRRINEAIAYEASTIRLAAPVSRCDEVAPSLQDAAGTHLPTGTTAHSPAPVAAAASEGKAFCSLPDGDGFSPPREVSQPLPTQRALFPRTARSVSLGRNDVAASRRAWVPPGGGGSAEAHCNPNLLSVPTAQDTPSASVSGALV